MAPAQSRPHLATAAGAAALLSTAAIGSREAFTAGASAQQRSSQAPASKGWLRGSVVSSGASATSSNASASLAPLMAVMASGLVGARSLRGKDVVKVALAAAATLEAATPVSADDVPTTPPTPPPFDPAAQLGAVEPLGFFDPLGFTQVGDESGFNKLRAAEIKHGRVAMMASIGAIGQPFVKFPWFEGANGTFGALASGRATFGMFILFAVCGILELAWREEEGKEPGNFGDPFGVDMYNVEMRNKEINNGRMAMISVLGIFGAELATGKNAIQQLMF